MSIPARLKRWYLGGPLPTREPDKNGGLICRLPNTFEPPIFTRGVRAILGFYFRNWQWLWGVVISIVVAAMFSV